LLVFPIGSAVNAKNLVALTKSPNKIELRSYSGRPGKCDPGLRSAHNCCLTSAPRYLPRLALVVFGDSRWAFAAGDYKLTRELKRSVRRQHKPFVGTTRIIQSATAAISVYCVCDSLGTMKLDDWLTRLVAVPPGRSPLANGLAIGMRIALFILIPLGIIAAIAIVLLHR
jgi:hypothetical protein